MPVTWSLVGIQDWWWVSASEVLVPLFHRVVTNICSTVTQSCNKYTRDRVVGVDHPGLSVCCAALQCRRAPRNRFPTCTSLSSGLELAVTQGPPCWPTNPPGFSTFHSELKLLRLNQDTLISRHSLLRIVIWSNEVHNIYLLEVWRFEDLSGGHDTLSWRQGVSISLLCHHYNQHNHQHWPIKK